MRDALMVSLLKVVFGLEELILNCIIGLFGLSCTVYVDYQREAMTCNCAVVLLGGNLGLDSQLHNHHICRPCSKRVIDDDPLDNRKRLRLHACGILADLDIVLWGVDGEHGDAGDSDQSTHASKHEF